MKNHTPATRNQTITLTDDERVDYTQKLYAPQGAPLLQAQQIINRTICADLMEVLDALPTEFADLIIVDPPYNLTKNFDGYKFHAMTTAQYLNYLQGWFPRIVRLLKPNGSLYLCGDWRSACAMQQIMEENLVLLNRISWQREKGRGTKKNWKSVTEDIWFGVKNAENYCFNMEQVKYKRRVLAPYRVNGKPKDWEETKDGNFRLTCPSNFWDDISVPYWSMPENTTHPTQKPEKLIAKLILASCPADGVVFDPFLGSGTTSVVAKKLGRNYCGIELNPEYCCLAEKRLAMAATNNAIQGYTNGIFWERNTTHMQMAAIRAKARIARRAATKLPPNSVDEPHTKHELTTKTSSAA